VISIFASAGHRHASRGCAARAAIVSAVVLGSFLPGGCKSLSLPGISGTAPAGAATFAPANHVHAGAIPASVRRVAVLPLHTTEWRAAELAVLDSALREALAAFERFEITPVTRAELMARFGRESFGSAAALPADFLARLRTDFGVDAVLFLDLAHYAPYQPVAIGLRTKLVTTVEGAALWSFDSLFDSAQADVAAAARQFSAGTKRPAAAAEDNTGVLQSPARFAKYVGHATFATMPPRPAE
jgi:hypothetical protein